MVQDMDERMGALSRGYLGDPLGVHVRVLELRLELGKVLREGDFRHFVVWEVGDEGWEGCAEGKRKSLKWFGWKYFRHRICGFSLLLSLSHSHSHSHYSHSHSHHSSLCLLSDESRSH